MSISSSNTVNQVVDVKDYHIFEDASSDASALHTTLSEEKGKVITSKNIICSDDVFMGPIADSCEDALGILESRMNAALENFSTIVSYFDEVATAYKKGDKKASLKVLCVDKKGSLFITDVNPNCVFDSKTGWCWPLGKDQKWVITSVNGSGHHGIDIATYGKVGMDVYAAQGGTVLASGKNGDGYGNWVKIQHDDGTIAIYGHFYNDQPMVTPGQRVEAGETIGQVGSTGNSSGPHVHFELRGPNGVGYLDPFTYYPELQAYAA